MTAGRDLSPDFLQNVFLLGRGQGEVCPENILDCGNGRRPFSVMLLLKGNIEAARTGERNRRVGDQPSGLGRRL
jgi:hypothetical protein